MNELERFLADHYEGQAAVTFARGSAGLCAILRALGSIYGPGEVIIPSVCCETVLLAVLFAGMTPVVAEVDQGSLCLDEMATRKKLNPRTRAIVLVYLFGYAADPRPFKRLSEETGVLVIEDLAQATGGEFQGRRLGTFLDATLLSFADGKIVQGQGGAIVLRKPGLLEAMIKAAKTFAPPPSSTRLAQLALSLRNLSHALYDLLRTKPGLDLSRPYREMIRHYEELVVHQGDVSSPSQVKASILAAYEQREYRNAVRRYYERNLDTPHLRIPNWPDGGTCWRWPLLVDTADRSKTLTRRLRQSGLPVSNHYFPLDILYSGDWNPNSTTQATRLLNLWVDATVTPATMKKTVRILNDRAETEGFGEYG